MLRLTLLALGTLLCTTAFASPGSGPEAMGALVSSMDQRVAIAYKVALTKWDSGKAVEDKPRERQVIDAALALAPGYSVSPQWAEQFFSAQIEANKLVQYAYLADWAAAKKAPDDERPNLEKDIRPTLDRLQQTLLEQMADATPYRHDANCKGWVASAIAEKAGDELRKLALVRASAELCTTEH